MSDDAVTRLDAWKRTHTSTYSHRASTTPSLTSPIKSFGDWNVSQSRAKIMKSKQSIPGVVKKPRPAEAAPTPDERVLAASLIDDPSEEERITTLESGFATLSQESLSTRKTVEVLVSRVEALEAQVESRVTALEAQVADLTARQCESSGRVDTVAGAQSEAESRVAALEAKISRLAAAQEATPTEADREAHMLGMIEQRIAERLAAFAQNLAAEARRQLANKHGWQLNDDGNVTVSVSSKKRLKISWSQLQNGAS